jgi:hypothetical protein
MLMMFYFKGKKKRDKYTIKEQKKSFEFYGWINRMVNESNFDNEERMVLYPNYLLSNNIVDPKKRFDLIFKIE